jgi:curli biogenesis system outer membrane secretion channel CsgG
MKLKFPRFPAIVVLLVLASAIATAQSTASTASNDRPTVAVLNLDYGTIARWWGGTWDIGKGVADLIVDGLLEDGAYRVIERKRLDAVLAEQNFSNSNRADLSVATTAQLGKALGVKYLIVGSITKFGTEKRDVSVRGGGFGGGRLGLGRVGTQKGKAHVALTVRVVDTTTGELLASAKGEAESKRSGLLLGGAGFGGAGAAGDIRMGSSEYRETILGEATEAAVTQVVEKLVAAKARLSAS